MREVLLLNSPEEDCVPHPTIEDTISFIQEVHTDIDWCGLPYWQHPIAVMNLLPVIRPGFEVPDSTKHAALLHDVIEDTDITADDLLARGYDPNIVRSVVLLTHTRESGLTYLNYIQHMVEAKDTDAMWVKYADNVHNTSPDRRLLLSPEKLKISLGMAPRYEKSKTILRSGLVGLI